MAQQTVYQFIQRGSLLLLILASLILGGCSFTGGSGNQLDEPVRDGRAVRSLLVQAVQAEQRGDIENADLLFQEMMMHEPRSPDALNSYAIFLREQWRLQETEAVYLRALKYSPNDAMTHWNMAVLYDLYLGKPDSALKHYEAYQQLVEEPDRRVHGWIVDMQHRVKQQLEDAERAEVASNE